MEKENKNLEPNIKFSGNSDKLYNFFQIINDWQRKNNKSDSEIGSKVLKEHLGEGVKINLKDSGFESLSWKLIRQKMLELYPPKQKSVLPTYNQKAYNDDIEYSGIFLKQYPKEEEWYKELSDKLKRFKKGEPINHKISVKNDVMHPRDYEYIVNNFVILFNQSEKPVMRLIRQGSNKKSIIDKIIVDYVVNFFVEFPNRESYYGYEIMVHVQRNATSKQKFQFDNSIVDVKLKGGSGLSDVSYGVPNDIKNKDNIRFYKDTNQYGEYLFMFNDAETKQILSEKGAKFDESVKGVPVVTGRDILQNRPQRNIKRSGPKYVSEKTYIQPSESKGKLRIGNKCMSIDSFGKIVPRDCNEDSLTQFEYKDNKIKHKKKCLSFHANGNLELLACDNLNSCKPNEDLNNCMNFKFIKYGGLEIENNNSCLNPKKNTFIAEPCNMSGKSDIN